MSSGKVKCTCGWSWNKSDSSKKDMYICHECGRDNSNNMKNGGWLDNYNDSEVSLPEGYVGEGYNTKGRDYSPAWGGQFQDGGKLTFLQPTSEKLPEGYRIPYADPSSELAMSIGGENGEPAYLIPSFKYGKPLTNPIEEFKKTGEHLGGPFKTWQEADKWEQEVRHPYVEKGQAIPMPIKTWGEMAMGGSIPQAQDGGNVNNEDYNMKRALELGYTADKNGHWPSVDYETGEWLKSKKHHTRGMELMAYELNPELRNKYNLIENEKGKLQYVPKSQKIEEYQIGGSIPGSVGFTYARTQSPAPSNGPYAKKTKASAQKGKTIPKLDISQLDLTIPKSTGYAWADNIVKKNKKGLEKVKELKTKVDDRGIAAIKKQYKVDDATAKKLYNNSKNLEQEQSEVRSYTPQSTLSKTWDVITNPMTALGYVARNEDLPDNFTRGDRSNLDMATDVINPAAWANYGALGLSDLSNVPGQLLEGDFQGAGESTLTGTLNMLGAVPLGQELKPFIPSALKTLPKAKNVKDALGTFRGIPTERSLPRLSPEELKVYRQVQEVGRMRATNKPISEQYRYAVDQNLPEEHLKKIFGKTKAEIENAVGAGPTEQELRITENNARRERLIADNQAEEARDMSNSMPDSLRERLNAVRARHEATQAASARTNSDRLDDMFAQLDAGTHPSQTAPRVSSTSNSAAPVRQDSSSMHRLDSNQLANITGSRSQDIARAMERDRLRQMIGRMDDEVIQPIRRVDPEAQNAVRSYSDDYYDLIETDGYGAITTEVNPSSKIERATDALEQFSGAANRIGESQAARLQNKLNQAISEYPYYEGPVLQNVPSLSLSSSGSLKNVSNKVGAQSFSGIGPGDVFTGSLNTSHSSYLPQLKQIFKYNQGAPQFFGYQPMNTLGFLSNFNYSADDIAKYLNTEIDDQIRRGIVPDNILRPYATNKPGVRYQSVQLPHYGIKQNPLTHRQGGVIKDDRGQWAYPGEITEIGSNQITMEGVPYPVLGISDTGDTKLMKPGKNYKFKGKKVTEYPMAKNGLRQEQKGLVNLDQLTNFTNYNTKQPGGWLDKY